MKTIYKDIDLTSLYQVSDKLIHDQPVELKLIEFYRYLHNEETSVYTLFTKWLLGKIYNKEVDKDYDEITFFYKERSYITVIENFNFKLEQLLFKYIDIDFIDIKFNKFIKISKEEIKVRFEIFYPKEKENE